MAFFFATGDMSDDCMDDRAMNIHIFQLGRQTQAILYVRDYTSLTTESENSLMNYQKLSRNGSVNVGFVETLVPSVRGNGDDITIIKMSPDNTTVRTNNGVCVCVCDHS